MFPKKKSIYGSFLLFLCAFVSFESTAQFGTMDNPSATYERRIYTTNSIRSESSITLDGKIEEAAWSQVEWASDFIEFEPDVGSAPSEQTRFKIIYDDRNLYVAFQCFESEPSTIERRLGRRDSFAGDWVEISIDSYGDDRTAFSFTISASGVKSDEFVSNNGENWDDSWNPIWYARTQIDDKGWTAEIRIPFTQLRFGDSDEQVWGLQSKRRYFKNNERSLWQPLPANPPGWVSEFGELRGLFGLKPQKQLELQPYSLAQWDNYEGDAENPYRDGSDNQLSVGMDAKIGVTNDLTVDLTINPDFGQVDADPGAIALDGFEIFFEERRPFFVENKSVFDYNFAGNQDNLFFSRRIGRTPQGNPQEVSTAFTDIPDNTTILGAAKLSGKTKDGWSLGVLESVTAKEYAMVLDTSGEETEALVEPLTNYFVGRVQKDFNNRNSYIGGIFTSTTRKMADNLQFLHSHAYTGGLDFKHNWKNRKYYLEGSTVFSQVRGSAEAITATQNSLTHLFQRVDADHVEVDPTRTSLTGSGGRFEIGKGSGGNWRYNIGGNWRSPELELNDVGFLRQADDIRQYANIRYFWNKPTTWFRQANVRLNQFSSFDFEGNYNRIQYEFNGYINWINNWWTEGGAAHKPRIYSNTILRGGPRWRWNQENFFFAFAGTDGTKKFYMHAGYVNSWAQQNNFAFKRYVLRFFYQPLNALNLSLISEFEQNPNKTQYVTEVDFRGTSRYILGGIDNESLTTTLRVNYSVNPNLSIQYYGQPFVFNAEYSNFNFVNDAVAEDLNERVNWYGPNQISLVDGNYLVDENLDGEVDYSFADPNFSFVQFRSNLVVRWEYIPGSEIFLVWSQGVTGIGDPTNDFQTILDNQLFSQKPQNTFLIKATYRFVL